MNTWVIFNEVDKRYWNDRSMTWVDSVDAAVLYTNTFDAHREALRLLHTVDLTFQLKIVRSHTESKEV